MTFFLNRLKYLSLHCFYREWHFFPCYIHLKFSMKRIFIIHGAGDPNVILYLPSRKGCGLDVRSRGTYRNQSPPFTRPDTWRGKGGNRREWVSEKKNGVSTPDSFQAFFRRCTGQKKKCIVKRGQGWPLSLHHVGIVVYIKSRSIWRRSTSTTNLSASQARRLFWSLDTRVWQRDYVHY